MRISGQNPRTNADATFQDPVSEQQRSVHSISSHYDVTKVVILGIEYRYRSLSSIEVSSIDVIAGIVLTLIMTLQVQRHYTFCVASGLSGFLSG